jgi:hypothetical protein
MRFWPSAAAVAATRQKKALPVTGSFAYGRIPCRRIPPGYGPSPLQRDWAHRTCCISRLVPRHSDYDWLILSQSRMGKSFGATRIWMLRGGDLSFFHFPASARRPSSMIRIVVAVGFTP